MTDEQRRTLWLLAGAPDGCTESTLAAHGVTTETMGDLVREKLATVATEHVGRGRPVQVVRLRITGAGRKALA